MGARTPIGTMSDIEGIGSLSIDSIKADYQYPNELDLKPKAKGSSGKLHDKLLQRVLRRARESREVMQERYKHWRQIDQNLTAFIEKEPDDEELEEAGVRRPTAIVMPFSFAALETLLTHLTSTFLQLPIFRYDGVGPEDTVGALKLQHVIHQQNIRAKAELALHTQWRDAFVYGFGVITPIWLRKMVTRTLEETSFEATATTPMTGTLRPSGTTERVVDRIWWEGNQLINVDPYKYLPDPNVPVHEVQRGEYVGWLSFENYVDLLERENSNSEGLFNVKYLRAVHSRSALACGSDRSGCEDGRSDKYNGSRTGMSPNDTTQQIDVVYMYINLIPKEWGIGDRESPEKWMFAVANDAVLIKAQPLNLDHNLFPVAVCSPDFDGYSTSPVSRMEVIFGQQQYCDWAANSHIANQAKAINDMLVVDPMRINVDDLLTPGPGKIIRTRESQWGRGVKDAVEQLKVGDVTRGHMVDISIMADLIQQVTGASSSLQGVASDNAPERRTATESKAATQSAFSRLSRMARMISAQSMMDLGYMLAAQTIQLMSQDSYIKLLGDTDQPLIEEYGLQEESDRGRVAVSPRDIDVFFDVVPLDATTPGPEFADAWLQALQIIGSSEQLSSQLDINRIFLHWARLNGATDISQFRITSDAQVQQQAAAGQLQPVQAPQAQIGGI